MEMLHIQESNDRGVSESIGFLLIFSIVIAGIGLVTLYGYPLLIKQQVSADEKIMEKNMIVLQNDVKSLAYKTVPYKETSLKIGSGSLSVYNSSYQPSFSNITIKVSGTPTPIVDRFEPGELRYESVSAQTDISLQNGAVVMRPRLSNGSVVLAEPRWFYDAPTKTMVFNLINFTSDGIMGREGIGTVRMKLNGTNYYSYTIAPGSSVTLIYTPNPGVDYSIAWDNYLTKIPMTRPATPAPGTGASITYTLPTVDTLIIKTYEVKIESV
jgi:hypothetical protein